MAMSCSGSPSGSGWASPRMETQQLLAGDCHDIQWKKKKSSIFFNTPCHQVFRKWGEITLSLISSLTQGSPCTMAVLAGTHPLALGTSPPAGQGEGPPPSPPTALRIFPYTVRRMVNAHRAPCQCLLKQLASSEMCTLRDMNKTSSISAADKAFPSQWGFQARNKCFDCKTLSSKRYRRAAEQKVFIITLHALITFIKCHLRLAIFKSLHFICN